MTSLYSSEAFKTRKRLMPDPKITISKIEDDIYSLKSR